VIMVYDGFSHAFAPLRMARGSQVVAKIFASEAACQASI
jgi:hypothetical protein